MAYSPLLLTLAFFSLLWVTGLTFPFASGAPPPSRSHKSFNSPSKIHPFLLTRSEFHLWAFPSLSSGRVASNAELPRLSQARPWDCAFLPFCGNFGNSPISISGKIGLLRDRYISTVPLSNCSFRISRNLDRGCIKVRFSIMFVLWGLFSSALCRAICNV